MEAIDLAPTFLDFLGGAAKPHVLEGISLLPRLRQTGNAKGRDFVVSEYDYAMRRARTDLNVPISAARLTMIFDGRWKYIHAEGFRPMFFDLETDPNELKDLGDDPAFAAERGRLHEALFAWTRQRRNRITISDEEIAERAGREIRVDIRIGYWDEDEVQEARARGTGVPPVS